MSAGDHLHHQLKALVVGDIVVVILESSLKTMYLVSIECSQQTPISIMVVMKTKILACNSCEKG